MDVATRRLVRERAGNRCEYCHLPQEALDVTFHIEHITAKQHLDEGQDDADNLALACNRCNLHKGTNLDSVDPVTKEPDCHRTGARQHRRGHGSPRTRQSAWRLRPLSRGVSRQGHVDRPLGDDVLPARASVSRLQRGIPRGDHRALLEGHRSRWGLGELRRFRHNSASQRLAGLADSVRTRHHTALTLSGNLARPDRRHGTFHQHQ